MVDKFNANRCYWNRIITDTNEFLPIQRTLSGVFLITFRYKICYIWIERGSVT